MNKLEQAARQALEALEICNANVYVKGTEAITALREALAEQECKAKYDERFERLEKSEQQAEQEPVFKVGNLVTVNQDPYPALGQLFVQLWDGDDLVARVYADDEKTLRKRVSALNATPVRTKDLTDDEILQMYTMTPQAAGHVGFARAVIAADREKNK